MGDSLKGSLVQLSITSLMDCLSEINKKEKFIKEIPTEEHSKIVKFMRQESGLIDERKELSEIDKENYRNNISSMFKL